MVVVVEDGVRLPGLPPLPLEGDPGVVQDAVVVRVHQDHAERHCGKVNTELPYKAVPMLRECYRQVEAEVVSSSRSIILETRESPDRAAL